MFHHPRDTQSSICTPPSNPPQIAETPRPARAHTCTLAEPRIRAWFAKASSASGEGGARLRAALRLLEPQPDFLL